MTKSPEIYTLQAIDPNLLLNINNIPDNQLFDIARDKVYLPLITPNTRAVTNINNNKLDYLVTNNHLLSQEGLKVDFIINSTTTINTIYKIDYFFRYK